MTGTPVNTNYNHGQKKLLNASDQFVTFFTSFSTFINRNLSRTIFNIMRAGSSEIFPGNVSYISASIGNDKICGHNLIVIGEYIGMSENALTEVNKRLLFFKEAFTDSA